jgi:hypothetical protein
MRNPAGSVAASREKMLAGSRLALVLAALGAWGGFLLASVEKHRLAGLVFRTKSKL